MEYHKKLYQLAHSVSEEDFVILMENKYQRISKYESPDIMLDEVAHCAGLSVETIMSRSRKKEIKVARQFMHYLAIKLTPLTLEDIGFQYGRRDHATVINSQLKIQNMIDTNDPLLELYETLITKYDLK